MTEKTIGVTEESVSDTVENTQSGNLAVIEEILSMDPVDANKNYKWTTFEYVNAEAVSKLHGSNRAGVHKISEKDIKRPDSILLSTSHKNYWAINMVRSSGEWVDIHQQVIPDEMINEDVRKVIDAHPKIKFVYSCSINAKYPDNKALSACVKDGRPIRVQIIKKSVDELLFLGYYKLVCESSAKVMVNGWKSDVSMFYFERFKGAAEPKTSSAMKRADVVADEPLTVA